MSESKQTNRRVFLKSAAVAGAALALGTSGCATSAPRRKWQPRTYMAPKPPGGKLRIAFIGTGGIGGYHLEHASEFDIVCPCYCDVDTSRMGKAAEMHPNAKPYQDYRQMFDKEHKNIDAVMVGTPDHHHYPATMIAMQLGKHVYTQKPLTHTPWEARQLAEAMKKYQVATQMGNQGHASEGWRLIYEWINSGAIGDVVETHTFTDRPVWPQGVELPAEASPVPATLDWDVWLGPAKPRDYHDKTYHPFSWRGWWDFGAGALGDMACHTMDGVFWALDPGHPSSVEPVATTPMVGDSFPKASAIKWEFPRNGKRRAFTAYWYDGGLRPKFPKDLEIGRNMPATGNLFIGTKGTLMVQGDYGESPRIIPETRMKEIGKPPQMLERSPGHVNEWILAASGEKPIDFPKSNFAYAGPMTESILLGNIALRMARRLEWDGEKMEFTNIPEANQYVTKEYRDGWKF
ncbi:MAG: Gfo/Idh/MocA family oxidoreductase [Phycisphaerae bacterium]|nr:Gfo/Idh/MocA family oxidoreductase [Phycisphaerae bacterium]